MIDSLVLFSFLSIIVCLTFKDSLDRLFGTKALPTLLFGFCVILLVIYIIYPA